MGSEGNTRPPEINGGPTKRLFVSMLTRDIDLDDAILDLIDNSVDGAMRQERDRLASTKPFEGYYSSISLNEGGFKIIDNCGGIPDESVGDAFQLGRPNLKKDGDLPTIGMYGIGMKRAIFKMAREATVRSVHGSSAFSITYDKTWLSPENDDFQLEISYEDNVYETQGVKIQVSELQPQVSAAFADAKQINSLKEKIQTHFGYIIERGMEIRVNDDVLAPKTLNLYHADEGSNGIEAFHFTEHEGDVKIDVIVGFFRKLYAEQENDEEVESPRTQHNAGVTVICNDRVVLLNDRSMKTGWGDGGVPKYHPQFRAISGLISFTSNNAEKLPVATTKRGLDAGSNVYLKARSQCIEGLKYFTQFTNKWKGIEEEANKFFEESNVKEARTGLSLTQNEGTPVRGNSNAVKKSPNLPFPENKNPRRRVSFVRREDEIVSVAHYLFNESQHPSTVGQECFDRFLRKAKHDDK